MEDLLLLGQVLGIFLLGSCVMLLISFLLTTLLLWVVLGLVGGDTEVPEDIMEEDHESIT